MRGTDTKKIVAISAALAAASILWLIFSPYGWLRLRKIEQEKRDLARKTEKLEEENRKLREKADCLKGDKPCFEDVARQEYGLVRRNEIIITIPAGDRKKGK